MWGSKMVCDLLTCGTSRENAGAGRHRCHYAHWASDRTGPATGRCCMYIHLMLFWRGRGHGRVWSGEEGEIAWQALWAGHGGLKLV